MKLRHALTLIGLGWYLMVPPFSHNKTKLTIIYEKANDLLLIRYPWIHYLAIVWRQREAVSVSIWYPSWRRLGLIATGAASASATKTSAALSIDPLSASLTQWLYTRSVTQVHAAVAGAESCVLAWT